MHYLKAVLNNNQDVEIKNLKILITTGKKLNKNISRYEKELKKYNGYINNKNQNNNTNNTKKIQKIKTDKEVKKVLISKIDINKSKYTIDSVYSKNNKIYINFKTNISKEYVKFFEKKNKKCESRYL